MVLTHGQFQLLMLLIQKHNATSLKVVQLLTTAVVVLVSTLTLKVNTSVMFTLLLLKQKVSNAIILI